MAVHHEGPATRGDLDQLKQELSAKIEGNGAKIDANAAKIDANGAKIDANATKIDANGAKIDANAAKIDANSATLSRVSHQVVENSEKIDQLLSMSEKFNEYFDEVITTLDGLAADSARFDQERMATNNWLDGVESDVDKNKADIKEIKTKLAMP